MRILCVGDSIFFRVAVASRLRKAGHEVVESYDPKAVVRDPAFEKYGLVVTDLRFPGYKDVSGGWSIATKAVGEKIPVILTSDRREEADRVKEELDRQWEKGRSAVYPLYKGEGWVDELVTLVEEVVSGVEGNGGGNERLDQ